MAIGKQDDCSIPRAGLLQMALLLLFLGGCSSPSQSKLELDPTRAGAALDVALQAWKRGDKPSALTEGEAPILIDDFDWQSGCRLLSFQVGDEAERRGGLLRIPCVLVIEDGQRRRITKRVVYAVRGEREIQIAREGIQR